MSLWTAPSFLSQFFKESLINEPFAQVFPPWPAIFYNLVEIFQMFQLKAPFGSFQNLQNCFWRLWKPSNRPFRAIRSHYAPCKSFFLNWYKFARAHFIYAANSGHGTIFSISSRNLPLRLLCMPLVNSVSAKLNCRAIILSLSSPFVTYIRLFQRLVSK